MILLEKTRQLTGILQGEVTDLSKEYPYDEVCNQMSKIISCNVCVIDSSGRLLGYAIPFNTNNARVETYFKEGQLSEDYAKLAIRIYDTEVNLDVEERLSIFPEELKQNYPDGLTTLSPIYGAGLRLGTLILWREDQELTDDELVLTEIAATVMGVQLSNKQMEQMETRLRADQVLNMSVQTLSFSEQKAVRGVLEALGSTEGSFVASTVAERLKITRSVIVNALRKLESAGVIESRSLGMRGTYLKVLNPGVFEKMGIPKIETQI